MHPQTLEPNAQRLERREVTQMSKTKKLLAATLTVLALAGVPSTSVALIGAGQALTGQCNGGGGC